MQIISSLAHPIPYLGRGFQDLGELYNKSKEYIRPDKKEEFENQAALAVNHCFWVLKSSLEEFGAEQWDRVENVGFEAIKPSEFSKLRFQTFWDFLEKSAEHVPSGKRKEFEVQIATAVNECVEALKNKAEYCSEKEWHNIKKEWHELHAMIETLNRRLELVAPPSLEIFKATLWWMTERGTEQDLDLLKEIKHSPPYSSEELLRDLETAERRISERVNCSDYGVRDGDVTYRENEDPGEPSMNRTQNNENEAEIQHWVVLLRSSAREDKLNAASQLGRIGVRTREAKMTRGSVSASAKARMREDDLKITLEALSDAEPDVRREVAFAIGELADKLAVDLLSQLAMQDEESSVRVAAADALAKIGGSSAVKALQEIALKDLNEDVRASAVGGLGSLALESRQGWSAASSEQVKHAVRTRGNTDRPDDVTPIWKLLEQIQKRDSSRYVRIIANNTLAVLHQ
jgi:hypothetical protein